MTASVANGFAQINFDPAPARAHRARTRSTRCTRRRASTRGCRGRRTRTTWPFSDEIGHFQYCSTILDEGGDWRRPDALDDDDSTLLRPGAFAARPGRRLHRQQQRLRRTSVPARLAGTNPNHGQDTKYHADPSIVHEPGVQRDQNYARVAFEADMPRIEAADFGGNCNRSTGENCVNPPPGAQFYPIFTTGKTRHTTASGSSAGRTPGHDRTRSAETRRPSSARSCRATTRATGSCPVPVQQLQADPEQQPLSRLSKRTTDRGASSGAPLCFSRCGR